MAPVDDISAPTSDLTRPYLMPALYALAVVNALLVFVQAVLAGRWFAGEEDLITTHGWIGVGFLVLAVLQLALLVAAGSRQRFANVLSILAGLVVLSTAGQLGLGYSGRENADSAGWHIANGVLLMGLSVAYLCLLPRLRERRADGRPSDVPVPAQELPSWSAGEGDHD